MKNSLFTKSYDYTLKLLCLFLIAREFEIIGFAQSRISFYFAVGLAILSGILFFIFTELWTKYQAKRSSA